LPEHDPLQPHSHEPNPEPPSADSKFRLTLPDRRTVSVAIADLRQLPETTVANCTIVSTGHGSSGPFAFTGTRLIDLVEHFVETKWTQVEVISADGFGNRVTAEELLHSDPAGPILLAHVIDGRTMTRHEGAVRLIVPSETDDALRQVKWIGRVNIRP